MDSSSEQAQQETEVIVDSNSNEESLLTKSVHYIRLQTWISLAFSSLLVIVSLKSWNSMEEVNTVINIISLTVTSVTFTIATILTALIAIALIKTGEQRSYLLQLDTLAGGSYCEQYAIWTCLLLTSVVILLIPASVLPQDYLSMDTHANIFHGSWISWACSVRLFYLFTKDYKDIDLINAFRYGGTRCVKWYILLFTSCAMLVSSIYVFVSTDCRSRGNLDDDHNNIVYCRRTALSLGLAASFTFITTMVLIEIKFVNDYSKDLLLDGESLFSFTIFLSNAIAIIFITGFDGPAAGINTLYFAVWGTFLVSGQLSISCVVDLMERSNDRKEHKNPHSSYTNDTS